MAQHTPGPWEWDGDYTLRPARPDPRHHTLHTILSPDGPYGFLATSFAETEPEWQANKRLIAAAPALLEAGVQARAALSELVMTRDPIVYADALRALDAAIAKATGAQP